MQISCEICSYIILFSNLNKFPLYATAWVNLTDHYHMQQYRRISNYKHQWKKPQLRIHTVWYHLHKFQNQEEFIFAHKIQNNDSLGHSVTEGA